MGGTVAGAKTLGRYELISEVAKGQLGPLWAAKAAGDDPSAVLMRRVSTGAPTTPDEIDSLCEGAWWMLELAEGGLARGIDVVKTEGELGVVMEYAEGEVLRSLLRLASFKRRPIPVNIGLRIACDLLTSFDRAAAAGGPAFVPGGVVPDSVLVGRDGRTRLLDVGILGPASRIGPIARHPEIASYAAPEQLEDATKTDLRSNLYAVGVMLWEMLAGKRLFVGSTHQAVSEKVKAGGILRLDSSKPVGGDAVSSAVADLVAKALETSADARYAGPKELIDAIEATGEAGTHEQVARIVDEFAGNTLAARHKLIEKALAGMAPKPAGTAASPAPAIPPKAAEKEPAKAPAPPQRPSARKATLIGIQPYAGGAAGVVPPPRPPLESLDMEDLEPDSKIEVEVFPSSEAPTKPVHEVAQALAAHSLTASEGEAIKTRVLGTPAPDAATAIAAAAAEAMAAQPPEASPKPPEASAKPPEASPKPPEASPKPPEASPSSPVAEAASPAPSEVVSASTDAAPESVDVEDIAASEAPKPDTQTPGLDWGALVGGLPEGEGDGGVPPKKEEKRDESAVAWVGPPPGAPLAEKPPAADAEIEEPIPSMVPERTQRMRKMVAVGVGALAGVIALGVIISKLGGGSEPDEGSATTPAATQVAKKEEPKAEEPKKEEPKKEEPKAEEPEKEEPKAKPVATKPVVTKPVVTKPVVTKPTTTTKPAVKPKPKPKFTPSGI